MTFLVLLGMALSPHVATIETHSRAVLVQQCTKFSFTPADEADCYIQWGGLDIDPLRASNR